LNEYIAAKVKATVSESVRDRDILEIDSSVKVFTRAWSWFKIMFSFLASFVLIVGALGIWKESDFRASVEAAKQSVTSTAMQSKEDISRTLAAGKASIKAASDAATQQSTAMQQATVRSETEISKETHSFQRDLTDSRHQLDAATELQPKIQSLQEQLKQASAEIQTQQKLLTSSEDFAKAIFSTHTTDYFQITNAPSSRYGVLPPPPHGGNRTVVYLLLHAVPLTGTLQVQFHIYTQPPNSYANIKNLVVFFWGDSPSALSSQQLTVSYFPDDSQQKDTVKTLSEHDGRFFADDQPLPKLNQHDPDFKGDKWFPPPKQAAGKQ